MKITDNEVKKFLKQVRSSMLCDMLESYPEDERDGRTDMEMLADELSYLISCIHEDGHAYKEDAEVAADIIRETKNGKVMPLHKDTLTPVYNLHQVRWARETINENRRLENLQKRLNAMGYYGLW